MSEKHAVRVTIDGEEFTVRSEHPPEYTLEVAAYVDARISALADGVARMLPPAKRGRRTKGTYARTS